MRALSPRLLLSRNRHTLPPSWYATNTLEMRDIRRCFRLSGLRKVIRTRTEHPANVADTTCNHQRVSQVSDAHREIDALINQIDHSVQQEHVDMCLRVSRQERTKARHHMHLAE
jgi:hypothetical protein